jgi:hypothetical protein
MTILDLRFDAINKVCAAQFYFCRGLVKLRVLGSWWQTFATKQRSVHDEMNDI